MIPNILLSEYQLNSRLTFKNKIIMAPMTRAKATDDLTPTDAMADYYARRADAGLIITEGTLILEDALGYHNVPGIFNQKQITHWKKVTDKVHQNNGLIFSQLWHVGRVSHPHFLKGELPISASATIMTGKISRSNHLNFGKSRAATLVEIKSLIEAYAIAAKNAIEAGFDGIEIHGANGYLIDQFMHYDTNKREDEYGGSPENMAKFALQIVKACGELIGYDRVGIRLSPGAYLNEIIGDKRDAAVFQYLLTQLNDLNIAYVHTGNFDDSKSFKELNEMTMSQFLRMHFKGTLIGCGSYTFKRAIDAINNNEFDLIAIGRPFIANPDLIQRYRENKALSSYHAEMLSELG